MTTSEAIAMVDDEAAREAKRRLAGQPEFRIDARKSKDDRRNKDYYRTLTISAELPPHTSADAVAKALRRLLLEGGHRSWAYPIQVDQFGQWKGPIQGIWKWEIHSERPRDTMTEADAKRIAKTLLVPALHRAFGLCAEAGDERVRRETAVEQANRIAKAAGATARKRAAEATRYEQRLAGLRAELEAEAKVQITKLLDGDELDESIAQSGPFEPEAIEAGKRLAPRYAEPLHGFGDMRSDVTHAEVFGEEEG